MAAVSLYLLNFWPFHLVLVHLDRAVWIVSTDWVVSASVALNWVVSLSAWDFSFNYVFFVHMVLNIGISLLLALLFLIHQIFHSLLNFAASVADVFHAYFHFLFAEWIFSLSWVSHFFRFSWIHSLSNVIHWVVSAHSCWSSIWNVVRHLNSWVVPWNRTNLWFWLIHLVYRVWRSSHQSVFQIVFVGILTCLWTHNRRYFISPKVLGWIGSFVFSLKTVWIVVFWPRKGFFQVFHIFWD